MSTRVPASFARKASLARKTLAPFATALALTIASSVALSGSADARLGGGGSFGSRGSRSFSMPSATPTAPSVSPLGRSQFGGSSFNSFGGARPGFFSGGFGRGLLGGFLGAGVFGLLFGQGMFGGMGGGVSLIGLLLQLGLLYLAFRFIMGFFRRSQPAFGGGGMGGAMPYQGAGTGVGGGGSRGVPITIGPDDYQAFEQRLIGSQLAYSNGDVPGLRRVATLEMAGNFEQELTGNERQGVVNKITDVRLLQGDLSEAWREGNVDYASVAMRFSLIDTTVQRATGQIVVGNPSVPQQVTEVWTFTRPSGSGPAAWLLSAIQQA